MIDQTQNTGRTRPYPLPDVLRAITNTLRRPHANLAEPHRIDWPHRIRGYDNATTEFPAALLGLASGKVRDIAAWAAVLLGTRVTLFVAPSEVTITVIGRTSKITVNGCTRTGPVIAVYDTVSDWPLESPTGERTVEVDEFAAIVADACTADTLAGAR